MADKSSSIRGIHYEVSKPVKNREDGYYYQRVRQVDGDGNLVGGGEQIHRSANPDSDDGLVARPIDLAKLAALAVDVGQLGFGGIFQDLRTAAIGATKFARDSAAGVTHGYKSWPGTHKPWEPILDWRRGSSGADFVRDGGPGGIGDGRGIGNWRGQPEAVSRNQPRSDRWASIPIPDLSPPPLPRGRDWRDVTVRDSAAAAGVPSRNNVFEYGFPESSSVPTPSSEAPPVRKLSTRYIRPDGSTAAGSLAGRMGRPAAIDPSNAGWPAPSPSTGLGGADRRLPPSRAFDTGTSPIPYLPAASQQAPRGLPAMLAEVGAFDLSNPQAPPSGGLPGLIQEYLRNH